MITTTTPLKNIYQNLKPETINCYGDHEHTFFSLNTVKKRISSVLHWSPDYDHRNLAEYYTEWAKVNSDVELDQYELTDSNQDLFLTVQAIRDHKSLNALNSREIAHFVVAFKDKTAREHLSKILSLYSELKSSSGLANLNAYIQTAQQKLAQKNWQVEDLETISNDLKKVIATQSTLHKTFTSVINALKEDYIFEPVCSLSGYIYSLLPIIEVALTTLTASLLYTHFWSMFIALTLAELSVTVIGGLLSGAWHHKENGIIAGALQGLQEEWNQKVSNDHSFHPIVDAAFVGLYIASTWLWINQLEKDAQAGSLLYILAQYGISNFVLKYSAMNFVFTLKAQLHQGSIDASILMKNALTGAIRGVLKNSMINSMNHFFESTKLQIASSLQTYTSFLSETYLKEWWIKQVIAKTTISATPLWLLKDRPEKLISALWITREIIEINITNLSKSFALIAMAPLWPLAQKAYDYRGSVLMLIAASIIAHNNMGFLNKA